MCELTVCIGNLSLTPGSVLDCVERRGVNSAHIPNSWNRRKSAYETADRRKKKASSTLICRHIRTALFMFTNQFRSKIRCVWAVNQHSFKGRSTITVCCCFCLSLATRGQRHERCANRARLFPL